MDTQIFSMKQNYIRVCLDSISPDIRGTAFSLLSKTPIVFFSMAEFILEIDTIFDSVGYPQAFEEKRSFSKVTQKKGSYHGIPDIQGDIAVFGEKFGEKYTLELYVESRRKTNWQGRLFSVVGKESERKFLGEFESEMELLKILEKLD